MIKMLLENEKKSIYFFPDFSCIHRHTVQARTKRTKIYLCLEVLCVSEWSTKLQTGGLVWHMLKKNAMRQVQLSLPIETRIFKYPMHIYMYFDDIFKNQGNSHVSHNWNQANITIMQKKTSLTKLSWVRVNKELHNMTININSQTLIRSARAFVRFWINLHTILYFHTHHFAISACK